MKIKAELFKRALPSRSLVTRTSLLCVLFITSTVYLFSVWRADPARAHETEAPWRLDIDFGALSTDCVDEPKVTQIGDGWLRVDFVDDEGKSGTGYTKGTVLIYASPVYSEEPSE